MSNQNNVFNDNEINRIYSMLLLALKDLEDQKMIYLENEVNEFIKNEIDLSKKTILDWAQDKLDPDFLKELQEIIINNKMLSDAIQEIFFEKMLA